MHMKHDHKELGEATVPITFHMEDPESLTGSDESQVHLKAAKGQSILEVALDHGINIEHACGGVCACSTCHIYVTEGMDSLPEAEDDELDRVEEAPAIKPNSRLSCQCKIEGDGPISVRVPAWNRNAVKEVPH